MEVKLSLSQGQKKKLAEAASAGVGCVIQLGGVEAPNAGIQREEVILKVPARSAAKIEKMTALGKGMRLVLSKSSVMENKKIIGGFLPVLAGLAGAMIPQVLGSLFGGEDAVEAANPVEGEGIGVKGKGLYTHGYVPSAGSSIRALPPPPAIGRGMFLSRTPAPRPAGLPVGALAGPTDGSGMFIHGSDGRAGVPKAWESKTGAGIKKKAPKKH